MTKTTKPSKWTGRRRGWKPHGRKHTFRLWPEAEKALRAIVNHARYLKGFHSGPMGAAINGAILRLFRETLDANRSITHEKVEGQFQHWCLCPDFSKPLAPQEPEEADLPIARGHLRLLRGGAIREAGQLTPVSNTTDRPPQAG